jgi:hypothetical protein
VAVQSEKCGKTMSGTTNRVVFTALATAGLVWPVLVLSATAAPVAAPAPAAAPIAEAAPVAEAAGILAPPAPPVPVVPVPAAVGIPPVPPVAVPIAPIAQAVPGFPLLPSALPVPHDLVCEGTAWSAKRSPDPHIPPHAALAADRREW